MSGTVYQHYIHIDSPSFTSYKPLNEKLLFVPVQSPLGVEQDKRVFVSWSGTSFSSTTANDFKSVKKIDISNSDITMVGFLAE